MSGDNKENAACGRTAPASVKACIFDLDGTLADTVASIAYCGNEMLKRFGYEVLPGRNYCYYAGDGAEELVRRILRDARAKSGADLSPAEADREFSQAFSVYKEIFGAHCMYRVKPYDGITELLSVLKKSGVRIAVLSNKPHLQTVGVIETLFGKSFFDGVQGQQDGVPRKPAPDGAWKLAAYFSARPEECIYVGDTDTDMQTGNAAGMFTVGVLWGFREEAELRAHHAAALIAHPMELLRFLPKYAENRAEDGMNEERGGSR